MAYLSWIDDSRLKNIVGQLVEVAEKSLESSEEKFNKNVIDPFAAFFQMVGFNMDLHQWKKGEQTRQSQKTLQNHVGDFHQSVLGNVKGWDNLKTGSVMDVVSHQHKVIAEIKNKHNTVKGSDLSGLYKSMESAVMTKSSIYRGYSAYYVTVIPKKAQRFDIPFTPSDKETGQRLPVNEMIRKIDGASFYSMVTNDENALENLFACLPKVVEGLALRNVSEEDKTQLDQFFKIAFG